MPTTPSVVAVEQCSNWEAHELGLIYLDTNSIELEVTKYTINEESKTITLPTIDIFCDKTQDPTIIFDSATVTFEHGREAKLTKEDDLHAYGLTLVGFLGTTPTLKVFTGDEALDGASLSLVLRATVV